MTIVTEPYLDQLKRWPTSGRHILAHFDETAIVVYQAYRPAIGQFAAKNHKFGGEFSLNRMSWIKPNFLWMMYRSGWASKPGQEVVLAVRLKRQAFDAMLAEAVHSTYVEAIYGSQEAWKQALEYGVKITGCTVHFVDQGIDSGAIIAQTAVPVLDNDTAATLHARIQQAAEVSAPAAAGSTAP